MLDRLGSLGHDPINSTALWEVDGIATDIRIVPVEDIDAPLGSRLDTETDPGQVVDRHKIVAMFTDVAGTLGFHDIGQHHVLVDITHEESVSILGGKRVRQVETRAPMGRLMGMVTEFGNGGFVGLIALVIVLSLFNRRTA